jgi:hypothetical protein
VYIFERLDVTMRGTLPPGVSVRPWKYREGSTMSNEHAAREAKGVTVKLLATVDLGPEIEGMAGRQQREGIGKGR